VTLPLIEETQSAAEPGDAEWRTGWRIVAASALANATGISLLFYTFSLFVLPMAADLHMTRAQSGIVQSMIICAALGAPIIGWLADRQGFHRLFLICTLAMAAIELALWRWADGFASVALGTALIGFIGGGSATVLLTRPVNAHFTRNRGLALGLVGTGISLTTVVVPPWLQGVLATHGWRTGFLVLALLSLVLGLPAVLAIMPRKASTHGAAATRPTNHDYFRSGDFWLLVGANVCVALATSSAISQLSPMLQEAGLNAKVAALGVSSFAIGQFVGKLGGGWLMDRFEPRLVASALNVLPTLGFILLLTQHGQLALLLLGVGLIGMLQGADIGIFAYFVARRFGPGRYGAIFGALHGIGWIGTAVGVVSIGLSFDVFGGYWAAQVVSIGLLIAAAGLIYLVRLPPHIA
jgi:predicted MFS family arabinose efflux permease